MCLDIVNYCPHCGECTKWPTIEPCFQAINPLCEAETPHETRYTSIPITKNQLKNTIDHTPGCPFTQHTSQRTRQNQSIIWRCPGCSETFTRDPEGLQVPVDAQLLMGPDPATGEVLATIPFIPRSTWGKHRCAGALCVFNRDYVQRCRDGLAKLRREQRDLDSFFAEHLALNKGQLNSLRQEAMQLDFQGLLTLQEISEPFSFCRPKKPFGDPNTDLSASLEEVMANDIVTVRSTVAPSHTSSDHQNSVGSTSQAHPEERAAVIDGPPQRITQRWTPEDKIRLRDLMSQGKTYREVAGEMGRTMQSVSTQYRRMTRLDKQQSHNGDAEISTMDGEKKR